jgi:hypothetical protein
MTPSNAHGFPFVDEKQEDTVGEQFHFLNKKQFFS